MKSNFFVRLLPVFLLVVGLLSGCATQLETRTTFLTSGIWQFQSVENPALDQDTKDFYAALLGLADFQFLEDGTYEVVYEPNTFDDYVGTWEFNDDATVLTLDAGTADETANTIVELTEQTLVFTFVDSTGTNELTYIQ